MDTLDLSSGGEESDSDVDLVEEKIASKPKPKQSKDLLKQKLIQQFDKLSKLDIPERIKGIKNLFVCKVV